jgi:hypothetical protein
MDTIYTKNLFGKKLKVINIGTEYFVNSYKAQKVQVVHVNWKPPIVRNEKIAKLLRKLI